MFCGHWTSFLLNPVHFSKTKTCTTSFILNENSCIVFNRWGLIHYRDWNEGNLNMKQTSYFMIKRTISTQNSAESNRKSRAWQRKLKLIHTNFSIEIQLDFNDSTIAQLEYITCQIKKIQIFAGYQQDNCQFEDLKQNNQNSW